MESRLSRNKLVKKIALAEEIRKRKARNNFWSFCLYMDYDFFKEREAVLKQVAEAYQEIEEHKLDLLYVGMPPRTGKSYITTLFCAWVLGRHPEESVMRNTVTATLYSKFSDDLRAIMKGETHSSRYLDVFPGIRFRTDKVEGWKLTTAKYGVSYFGAGVGGSIIGFGATKVAILDDSIKNLEEAMSSTILQKKWDWYTSTHRSRKEKGVPEIHVATRWSTKDIPGRLESAGEFKSSRAKKIVIPALVNGKSYCEAAHTTEELLREKEINDELVWQAVWMQNPIEAKGLLMPLESLNKFSLKELHGGPDAIIGFCDTADEGTDFLCFVIGYVYGEKVYIVDVVFNQDEMELNEPRVAQKIIDHNADFVMFESNNGGKGFARNVARIIKETVGRLTCTIKWRPTTRNKETRIIMKAGFIKKYFHFRNDYKLGSEYAKYINQLTSYSKAGKNDHDDANDATTGLAELIKSSKGSSVKAKVV